MAMDQSWVDSALMQQQAQNHNTTAMHLGELDSGHKTSVGNIYGSAIMGPFADATMTGSETMSAQSFQPTVRANEQMSSLVTNHNVAAEQSSVQGGNSLTSVFGSVV